MIKGIFNPRIHNILFMAVNANLFRCFAVLLARDPANFRSRSANISCFRSSSLSFMVMKPIALWKHTVKSLTMNCGLLSDIACGFSSGYLSRAHCRTISTAALFLTAFDKPVVLKEIHDVIESHKKQWCTGKRQRRYRANRHEIILLRFHIERAVRITE